MNHPTATPLSPSFGSRRPAWVAAGVCFVLTFLIYTMTAAPTITERWGGVDGAELAATALSGGVPHPSGYPTFMLLARLLLLVVPGEAARVLVLLSSLGMAVAAAATALCVWLLVPRNARSVWISAAPAVFSGLLFGLGPRAWSQGIIPEVYGVYLGFMALAALLVVGWLDTGRPALLVLAAGVCGIGTGTHLTIVAVAAGAAVATLVGRRRIGVRLAVCALVALVAGSMVYVLLPVWGMRPVVPNWGDWTGVAGWWQHITGAEYRYLVGIVPWSQRLQRISFVARDLLVQLGPLGCAVAIWFGLAHGWTTARAAMLFTGTLALLSLVFSISYGAADGEVYLLPWTWCWAVWAGLGVSALMASNQRQGLTAVAVLLVVLTATTVWRYPSLDLHADASARERAVARLQALAPDAILTIVDDAPTFGSWYAQTALGVRTDVIVVDLRLLGRPWYDRQVRQRLGVGEAADLCDVLGASERPVYAVEANGDAQPQTNALWVTTSACRR